MDAKLDLDKLHVKDAGKLMLNSFDEMYEYLKEKGDSKGKELYGSMMLRTAVLLDSLCSLHEKKIALIEKENE